MLCPSARQLKGGEWQYSDAWRMSVSARPIWRHQSASIWRRLEWKRLSTSRARARRIGFYLKAGDTTFIEVFAENDEVFAERPLIRHFCLEAEDLEKAIAALQRQGIGNQREEAWSRRRLAKLGSRTPAVCASS